MKFKIFFTVDLIEDYFIIEADTLEEVSKLSKLECDKRHLNEIANDLRSEKK